MPKFYLYMKKKVRIIVLFAAMVFISAPVSAQIENFVGVWAQGGEYSYLSNVNGKLLNGKTFTLPSSLGGGGGLGVMYEMRAGRHFLLDAGLGFNTTLTQFKMQSQDTSFLMPNQSDTIAGLSFNYKYEFSNRRDGYLNTSLLLPVMVGGQWGNFYFLAGAKLEIPLASKSIIKMDMNAKGLDILTNELLPDSLCSGFVSGFKSTTIKDTINLRQFPKMNVNLSAELGFRLGKVYKERGFDVPNPAVQYRLALFGEVGLLDVHVSPGDEAKPIYGKIPGYTYGNFDFKGVLTDVISSKEAKEAGYPHANEEENGEEPQTNDQPDVKLVSTTFFRSFMVGVKFTVLFRLPEKKIRRVYYDVPIRSSYGILE